MELISYKNPVASGAIRSLLGKDFGLPILMSNHRVHTPQPAQEWHVDGGAKFGPQLDYLQVFYLPQECTREMGPTELLPGSHFLFSHRDAMKQIGRVRGSYYGVAPAGSIIITHYGIWHRRSESRVSSLRNNLKYNYWRTVPPERDWIVEPEFDFQTASYSGHHPARYYAHMFYWLCGKGNEYRITGGQSWPWQTQNQIGPSYGYAAKEGYLPNWRKDNRAGYAH